MGNKRSKRAKKSTKKDQEAGWNAQQFKSSLEKIRKSRESNNDKEGRRVVVKGKDLRKGLSRSNSGEARESNPVSDRTAALGTTESNGTDERLSQAKEKKEKEYWDNLSPP